MDGCDSEWACERAGVRCRVDIDPRPEGTTAFGNAQQPEGSTAGSSLWVNYFSIGMDAKVCSPRPWRHSALTPVLPGGA